MNWKERYTSIKLAVKYGEDHPSQELLANFAANVNSFYDNGGHIEVFDALTKTTPELVSRLEGMQNFLETNKDELTKRVINLDNRSQEKIQDEILQGLDNTSGILMSLKSDGIMRYTDGRNRTTTFLAVSKEGYPSGYLNVSYLHPYTKEEVDELNHQRNLLNQQQLEAFHRTMAEFRQRTQQGFNNDPWEVNNSSVVYKPTLPTRPQSLKPIEYISPTDQQNYAAPSIATLKLVPGTGSALQHALAKMLSELNMGVSSSYAHGAKTFHIKIGRRVDWTDRPDGMGGMGTSIWLPSDVHKIANMDLSRAADIRKISKQDENEHDHDSVHPIWSEILGDTND